MWKIRKLFIINKILITLGILCGLVSCRKDSDTPTAGSLCPPVSGDTTNVSYSRAIKPFLEEHCVSCHKLGNSMGNVLLHDYPSVQQYAANGRLIGAITRKPNYTPMPPGQDMPACLTNPIITWIREGSKNN